MSAARPWGKYLKYTPVLIFFLLVLGAALEAAELQARTIAAFDRYVRVTEARINGEMEDPTSFLFLDTLPEKARRTPLAELQKGRLIIERLNSKDARGQDIDVPDAMVHHWVGVVFVPGTTADKAVALMQDYNRHASLFNPAVQQSKVLWREGDHFSVFLRFRMKKIIEAIVNSEHDARFTRKANGRVYSRLVSTRIAQVDQAGTANEREKAVGNDDGFLWRLNTYWRYIERDGGTYIQCETISLSRGIPLGLGWIIGPFVTSIPRESLTFTLEKAREALVRY